MTPIKPIGGGGAILPEGETMRVSNHSEKPLPIYRLIWGKTIKVGEVPPGETRRFRAGRVSNIIAVSRNFLARFRRSRSVT